MLVDEEDDQLVSEWRAIHRLYAEAKLLAGESDLPEATDPSLADAQQILDRCFVEITRVVRDPSRERDEAKLLAAHAARIREARSWLSEARAAVEAAHSMARHARQARERARQMWEEERRRWERMQRGPKR
jgi:hypothetical protein